MDITPVNVKLRSSQNYTEMADTSPDGMNLKFEKNEVLASASEP